MGSEMCIRDSLYADLHAHLIAMPLTFLSLALALTVVQRAALPVRGPDNQARPAWWNPLTHLALLFLWALIIGAMRTTNTWDVPPHPIVAFGAPAIPSAQRPTTFPLLILAGQMLILVALSWWLLYWPFWEHYGSFYNSLGLWNGTRTPVWAYLVVHGLFLFPIASYLAARTLGDWRCIPILRRLGLSLRYAGQGKRLRRAARLAGARGPFRSTMGLCLPAGPLPWIAIVLLLLAVVFFLIPGLIEFTRADPLVVESGGHAYRGCAADPEVFDRLPQRFDVVAGEDLQFRRQERLVDHLDPAVQIPDPINCPGQGVTHGRSRSRKAWFLLSTTFV